MLKMIFTNYTSKIFINDKGKNDSFAKLKPGR